MKTTILLPCSYFDRDKPDDVFAAEHRAVQDMTELDVRLCNFDEFDEGSNLKLDRPANEPTACIWRGWMMTPKQYVRFHKQCGRLGLDLITSPEAYELMHCFPNACKLIDPGDTPRMVVFGDRMSAGVVNGAFDAFMMKDFVKSVKQTGFPQRIETPLTQDECDELTEERMSAGVVNGAFDAFMMKDFVKSVKQTGFPQRIETPLTQDECDELTEEFIRLRGDLYTGGIVCKQYVELKKYAMRTNEWRGFYLGGRLLTLSGNSMQPPTCPKPADDLVARMEGFASPFYTVDFGELEDGTWTVLETGDGQVSGLATEITPEAFYATLAERLATETDPQHFPTHPHSVGYAAKK